MTQSLQFWLRSSLFLIAAVAIYAGNLLFIVPSPVSSDLIAASLLIDLAIWVPFLYYLLLARPGLAPAFLTKIWITSGVLTAFYLMPQQAWLAGAKSIHLPIVLSVGCVLFAIGTWRFTWAWRQSHGLQGEQRIAYLAEQTGRSPGLIKLMMLEWTTLYYGTIGWKLKTTPDNQWSFSYHQKSGAVGLIVGLSCFHVPGVFFTHIIFQNISPLMAILLTVVHLYSMFFGLAHAMAMRNRLIRLQAQTLSLRNGLLMNAEVAWRDIASIERVSSLDVDGKAPGRLHLDFLGQANVLVTLKTQRKLPVMMGLNKNCRTIVLVLDEPVAFVRRAQEQLQNHE